MNLNEYLKEYMINENIPILFIGAGFTKRYCKINGTSPPKWDELLRKIISSYSENKYHYELLEDEVIKLMNDEEKSIPAICYQKIAQKIEEEFKNSILRDKLLDKELQNKILSLYDKDKSISPMKIYISILFENIQLTNDPKLLEEIEELKKIANKPLIIITTNYDIFLEKEIFKEYYIYKGQELLTDSYFASIFKIHGCITQPKSIVITENDYQKMEKVQKVLNARLITFFAEHPVFFLGYSLDDLNIQEFMNNIFESFSANSEIIEKISKKFILIDWNKSENKTIVEDFTIMKAKTMPVKKIKTDNYLEIYKALNNFNINIDIKKFQFMQELFLVALTGDKEEKLDIVFASEYTGGKLPEKILVGAGYGTAFLAYDLIAHYSKILKIAKNDFPISSEDFFIKFLPIVRKGCGGTHIPIFHFFKNYNFEKELPEKSLKIIKHSLGKIIDLYKENMQNSTNMSYNTLKEILDSTLAVSKKEKFITQLYINKKISNQEILIYIRNEFEKKINTFLRRLILLYDYNVNSNSTIKEKIKEKLSLDLP